MINPQSPSLLNKLIGKIIDRVYVSTAHGEVLTIYFTDNTYINICSTFGLHDKSIKSDRNNIYVSINGEIV